MFFDAIVLAGGRASRLGGASKPALRYEDQTLLRLAIDAVSSARHTVIVGDPTAIEGAAPGVDVLVTREVPAFGGPASAIAAGLDRLGAEDAQLPDFTFVLACDMPRVADVVALLLSAAGPHPDGAVAVSPDGRIQHLAALYSTARLVECVIEHRNAGDLDGLSVRTLVSELKPHPVAVREGATDDVDTWADAQRLGVTATHPLSI